MQKWRWKIKKKDWIEKLKILSYYCKYVITLKNMAEENISQEYRLKNIDETRNYLIEEINQSELMSKKHKWVCATLNYIEHFLILGSTISGWCISISHFASLVGIPIGITNAATGLNICTVTAAIKKYKLRIKRK